MKYSTNFERDFKWYLKIRHLLNFDGAQDYFNKKGETLIQFDKDGNDGKYSFYTYDSQGKILKTKHPRLLKSLLRTKGSVNWHIKNWAAGRADGTFPGIEFDSFLQEINAPQWVKEATEKQKALLYKPILWKDPS